MPYRLFTGPVVAILLAAPSILAQDSNPSVDPRGRFGMYRADQDTDEVFELYRSDLKTGAVSKLNGELVAGGDVNPD